MMTNGRERFMGRRRNWLDVGCFLCPSENCSSFCDPHQRIKANIEHSTSNVERSQNFLKNPRRLSGIAPMAENKQLHPIGWSCSKKLDRSERLSASRTGGDRRASPTQLPPAPAAQAWSARARS